MMKIIGFVAALWLGLMLFAVPSFSAWLPGQQTEAAIWLGFLLHAAHDQSPVAGVPVHDRSATAKSPAGIEVASDQAAPATRGADLQVTDISTADADVAALQQCKAACTPQCESVGNADRTEHCQQSCEMHCNESPGK